jgi:hypothetical protein
MGWAQLRKLANQTPGITRHKKNKEGKWSTKTSKELKEDLLALKNVASAQALQGRKRSIKALAPVSGSTKTEITASGSRGGKPRHAQKRPASIKNVRQVRKAAKLQR